MSFNAERIIPGMSTVVSKTSNMLMPSMPTEKLIPREAIQTLVKLNCAAVCVLSKPKAIIIEMTSSTKATENAKNLEMGCFNKATTIDASNGSNIKSTVSIISDHRVYENATIKITPITITKM